MLWVWCCVCRDQMSLNICVIIIFENFIGFLVFQCKLSPIFRKSSETNNETAFKPCTDRCCLFIFLLELYASRTSQPPPRWCAGRWIRWRKRRHCIWWWRSWRGTRQERLWRGSWSPTRPPHAMWKRWRLGRHIQTLIVPHLTLRPCGEHACFKIRWQNKHAPTEQTRERKMKATFCEPRCRAPEKKQAG